MIVKKKPKDKTNKSSVSIQDQILKFGKSSVKWKTSSTSSLSYS